MYTYFLSDIHMGLNSKENWHQQYVHQSMIKRTLSYIQKKGSAVNDVVVLGDWFDTWEYGKEGPMPSQDAKVAIQQIIDNNSNLFTRQPDGDFITCMEAIGGNLWYVNGNHDMTVNCRDLNKILIFAHHGHQYSLTCNVDNHSCNKIAPIPLGYFVSRTGASYCLQELQQTGKKSAAELLNSGVPSLGNINSVLKKDIENAQGNITFAYLFLAAVIMELAKATPSDYRYIMPDSTAMTGSDAASMYSWMPKSSFCKLEFLETDVSNNLDGFAQRCCDQKYKLMVFGHTHVPKILYTDLGPQGKGLYANTGYLCADIPGMTDSSGNGRYMTFCEVEQQPGSLTTRIMAVDYLSGTVAQLSTISPQMIPI
jgi:UDP-2,3-diacylglucosamine pyrophosphatase LpxH